MSPLRAKTYVRLFAALSLSVLANLLFFQPRLAMRGTALANGQANRVDASPVGGSGVEAKAMRIAAIAPKPNSPEKTGQMLRAIQRELKDIGHYPGEIDGRNSQLLHAAIFAYQQQYGLTITAEAGDPLLAQLLSRQADPNSAPANLAPAGAPGIAPGSAADKLITDVRQMLGTLGYKSERSDGRLTLDLIRVIRKYETDNAMLPPTGRISAALIAHLQRKAAGSRQRTG